MSTIQKVCSQLLDTPAKKGWEQYGPERHAIVSAPVPMLRSENSVGNGGILDQIPSLRFMALTGIKSYLPVPNNPIGFAATPYGNLDAIAMEPGLGSIEHFLPGVNVENFRTRISELKKELTMNGVEVDQEKTHKLKMELFWEMFLSLEDHEPEGLRGYINKHKENWLQDTVAFFSIMDQQGDWDKCWWQFPEGLKDHDDTALAGFIRTNSKEMTFHSWLQYKLMLEQTYAKGVADSLGKKIIGDLPTLFNDNCTQVWAKRNVFRFDKRIGFPPDLCAEIGQRLGQVPFDLEELERTDYELLKTQIEYFELLYHGFRIDHIFGFSRTGQVDASEPIENQGLNVKYSPEDPSQWESNLRKRLKVLFEAAPSLAAFGEDVGTTPPNFDFRAVCAELGVSLKDIPRWKKDHDGDPSRFSGYESYRPTAQCVPESANLDYKIEWLKNVAGTIGVQDLQGICKQTDANFEAIRDSGLFDLSNISNGTLRWNTERVNDPENFLRIIEKNMPGDQIDSALRERLAKMYKTTFGEAEKYLEHIGISHQTRETVDLVEFSRRAFETNSGTPCFAYTSQLPGYLRLKNPDLFFRRVNTPGTIEGNWRSTMPRTLEDFSDNLDLVNAIGEVLLQTDRLHMPVANQNLKRIRELTTIPANL